MTYTLDIDPTARDQIQALPPKALVALADQEHVDVLLVTWMAFDDA